jgi:hypothetical protein
MIINGSSRRAPAALQAPLRDGFASLDPAATRTDLGGCGEEGKL